MDRWFSRFETELILHVFLLIRVVTQLLIGNIHRVSITLKIKIWKERRGEEERFEGRIRRKGEEEIFIIGRNLG